MPLFRHIVSIIVNHGSIVSSTDIVSIVGTVSIVGIVARYCKYVSIESTCILSIVRSLALLVS